jgi:hypothetical protein
MPKNLIDNSSHGKKWEPVDLYGAPTPPKGFLKAFRNRYFLAQIYEQPKGYLRLSVNSTFRGGFNTRFKDGITWEDLQQIKSELGYGDRLAVEIYPKDCDLVIDILPPINRGIPKTHDLGFCFFPLLGFRNCPLEVSLSGLMFAPQTDTASPAARIF